MLSRVALLSLETWDDTWRRNQHLVSRLIEGGHVGELLWISPPSRTAVPARRPLPGITVMTPRLRVPRRLGGLKIVAAELRPRLASVDLLWINDPRLGQACLTRRTPALYDVTDDWRSYAFPERIVRKIVQAEDQLVGRSMTVVCSPVLATRWVDRYAIHPAVVRNGVDLGSHRRAIAVTLPGSGPHVGYLGTLQGERLDLDLLLALAALPAVGTVHLVGPDALDPNDRRTLEAAGVRVAPPVPAGDVPGVMAAMDLLVAPHLVNAFTLSLDAIKSYEYTASGRPVVATPTSGFQDLLEAGVRTATGEAFLTAVTETLNDPSLHRTRTVLGSSWDDRVLEFAALLEQACL